MACQYAYYNDGEVYCPRLYCNIDNKYCLYSKKCLKVDKFIPLENYEECYKFNMENRKNIPSGSYYIASKRPNKNGKLYIYVDLNNETTVEILTKFTQIDQDFIYLQEGLDGYEVSLTPFKRTVSKKKTEQK